MHMNNAREHSTYRNLFHLSATSICGYLIGTNRYTYMYIHIQMLIVSIHVYMMIVHVHVPYVPSLIRPPYFPRNCGHIREVAFGEREKYIHLQ